MMLTLAEYLGIFSGLQLAIVVGLLVLVIILVIIKKKQQQA